MSKQNPEKNSGAKTSSSSEPEIGCGGPGQKVGPRVLARPSLASLTHSYLTRQEWKSSGIAFEVPYEMAGTNFLFVLGLNNVPGGVWRRTLTVS